METTNTAPCWEYFVKRSKVLFSQWAGPQRLLRDQLDLILGGKQLFLFLDFDGTLAPIVETPDKAELPDGIRDLLGELSHHCQVAIVSGRSLADIQNRVGLETVICVGNHGFEISGPGVQFDNQCFPDCRPVYQEIIHQVQGLVDEVPGIFIEDKGETISIHYRTVPEKQQARFERIFGKIVKPYLQTKVIDIRRGKKVYEVRPPVEWDKGQAVQWLLREHRVALHNKTAVALYVGDDETDEDAFEVLQNTGVTVRVGFKRNSKAQYFVDDIAQVKELLTNILYLEKDSHAQT